MGKLVHFLLIFDHDKGELLVTQEFTDSAEALVAYADAERKVELEHSDALIEVVLIGSDSIETIMRTHANYFDGTVSVSEYLAGI